MCEKSEQRNDELLSLWRKYCQQATHIRPRAICRKIAASTASRYYIGVDAAFKFISQIHRGTPFTRTGKLRRQMYRDLYAEVQRILSRRPNLPLRDAVIQAVYSEAPQFYLTPESIYVIISQH